MSPSSDEGPTTWKSIKQISSILRGLAITVGTRVGLMISLIMMFTLMMSMLRRTPTDLMQNTMTMGRSPTGGLDNILRFDKLSIAGVRVFKPGEDEDNPWVPVKSLHTPILNVEQESPVDEYETKVAREISGGGADVSYDDGGEASQITTSCEGPPDGALRDDQHSPTDEEESPCPTQGGGEDGVRNTVLHE